MSSFQSIQVRPGAQVTEVRLNRPERCHALDSATLEELGRFFAGPSAREARVVVLTSTGPDFCSGADLAWMRDAQGAEHEGPRSSALLERLYSAMLRCPTPIVARVFGRVYAGGLGLAAASDVVLAHRTATFCMSEVRVGLAPAVMAPVVAARIGVPRFRELALSGRVFDAEEAKATGLVDHLLPSRAEQATFERYLGHLLSGAPGALTAVKELSRQLAFANWEQVAPELARVLTERRQSDEAQEGIRAFFEKRPARWVARG